MSDEVEELPEIDEAVVGAEQAPEEGGESVSPGSSEAETPPQDDPPDLGLILEVPLRLSVELGSADMPVRDVLALSKGSIVELDRMSGEPADIYANDRLIARGELTQDGDRVAVRITELVSAKRVAGAA